jgi:precorrin-8X/cobalt-precorrin-8 methylmutase
MISYERDGASIYKESFATIRAETDLSGIEPILSRTIVRMIHSCGMVDLVHDVVASDDFGPAAREAIAAGAPILCDTSMVATGITRSRLPAGNDVVCTLTDPRVPAMAAELGNTRTAAALELWREQLGGAVVAIGNAPTALFRLLELLEDGAPAPAAVIGVPVGFIGAAESKDALAAHPLAPPFLIVRGRRGGSAIAVGAINALASAAE